jgi:cell division protein FtsW (lipid II flippase)
LKLEVRSTATTTITTTLAATGYPVDFMTELMTIASPLLAIAGTFFGFIITKEGSRQSEEGRDIVISSLISIGLGVVVLICVLEWFNLPATLWRNLATWSILAQFLITSIPVLIIGTSVLKRVEKPKQPPK